MTDTAIQKRLKACVPWIKALLGRLLGAAAALREGHLRFVVVDGSTVRGLGATGTGYRLHLSHAQVADTHTGESLRHYPLRDGDVVVADHGYNSAPALIECADRGVAVVMRYNPHGLNLIRCGGSQD